MTQLSENMGINPDTRFVFTHSHVADMMISILDAPMIVDGVTKLLSAQNDG